MDVGEHLGRLGPQHLGIDLFVRREREREARELGMCARVSGGALGDANARLQFRRSSRGDASKGRRIRFASARAGSLRRRTRVSAATGAGPRREAGRGAEREREHAPLGTLRLLALDLGRAPSLAEGAALVVGVEHADDGARGVEDYDHRFAACVRRACFLRWVAAISAKRFTAFAFAAAALSHSRISTRVTAKVASRYISSTTSGCSWFRQEDAT